MSGGISSGAGTRGRSSVGTRGSARSRAPSRCGAPEAVDELGERRPHAAGTFTLRQVACRGTGDDDVVGTRRQALGLLPERLAQHPLDAVAVDGTTDAARNGQPESRPVFRAL